MNPNIIAYLLGYLGQFGHPTRNTSPLAAGINLTLNAAHDQSRRSLDQPDAMWQ